MIDIFHTKKELKDTGLKMFNAHVSSDIKIGEKYLQPSVISMWDFNDYSNFYTYFDNNRIQFVVNVCVKVDEKTTKTKYLRKDLSNIIEEMPLFKGTLERLDRFSQLKK